MGPVSLFALASQNARWLTARQALVSQNVANANTPSYRAMDVRPFSDVLDNVQIELASTQPGHISMTALDSPAQVAAAKDGWDTTVSGNSVVLEQEMMKAGDINRSYALNTNVVKSFQRMLLSTVKV